MPTSYDPRRVYRTGWRYDMPNRGQTLRPMGYPDRAYYQENRLPRPYLPRDHYGHPDLSSASYKNRDTNHWNRGGDQWANYRPPYLGGGGWRWGPR
jgi:hypothetical protein